MRSTTTINPRAGAVLHCTATPPHCAVGKSRRIRKQCKYSYCISMYGIGTVDQLSARTGGTASKARAVTALHCTGLLRTTPHCTTVHRTALHYCTALHRTAQSTAPHCTTALHGTVPQRTAPHRTPLHCTAPHCTVHCRQESRQNCHQRTHGHCTAMHRTVILLYCTALLARAGGTARKARTGWGTRMSCPGTKQRTRGHTGGVLFTSCSIICKVENTHEYLLCTSRVSHTSHAMPCHAMPCLALTWLDMA